ncbi:hypothetical protein BU17DRAFT_73155 [Hysterangium stoloniferum]|nr:hypothetical protein BU17DRAFT_73155 [Hysterangium stoloniferum]
MSETRKRTSRSLSNDLDSDGDLDENGLEEHTSQNAGKPGRKKNPNSQAARRDQNRIAQREFRLRKQQRIRDLEARVEILSGSKDETYVQMHEIIRELISENHTLRNMVRGLSNFIGDGAGGALPSMGWTLKEFEAFINKAETDTAFEAFLKRKKAQQGRDVGADSASGAEKRPATDDPGSSRKRARSSNGFDGHSDVDYASGVSFATPYTSEPSMNAFSNIRQSATYSSNFLNGLAADPRGTNTFLAGTSTNMGYSASNANSRDVYPSSYPSSATTSSQSPSNAPSIQNRPFMQVSNSGSVPTPPQSGVDETAIDDPKSQEARKLMGYHLDNFRRNSAYCLPPSLRPTLVQRTVEHEGIIDGIPHPELRNRMILLRGRFNLAECIHKYLTSTTIHGDDVLAHANWEIHEDWLKQFGYLVDATTLSLTNRWRKERGEPEIQMGEIAASEQLPGLGQT